MAGQVLSARAIGGAIDFNWLFLIELLIFGALTLFFLFYFNRVFAFLVSHGIRAYTWHKYRVHVDIQSLQFSLLAGRIFFRGFRYHGENETILIQGGHITWRYWYRKVRPAVDREKGTTEGLSDLPCRLLFSLSGVEWYIYNRSAAYDAILQSMQAGSHAGSTKPSPNEEAVGGVNGHATTAGDHGPRSTESPRAARAPHLSSEKSSPTEKSPHQAAPSLPNDLVSSKEHSTIENCNRGRAEGDYGPADSPWLNILPIHVDCNKGAVVMGNERTPCVLTTRLDKAMGDIDVSGSKGRDKYKQQFNFRFIHPVVQIKPNVDFETLESPIIAAGRKAANDCVAPDAPKRQSKGRRSRPFDLWHSLRARVPYFAPSMDSLGPGAQSQAHPTSNSHDSNNRWTGLSRYLDDSDADDPNRWSSIEYAKLSNVLDSPSVAMSFYWDVPGLVHNPTLGAAEASNQAPGDINGDVPPEWGIDLVIQGGTVNYGPWTDRQRALLQAMFFPQTYADAVPAKALSPGDSRVSTVFKLFVELREEVLLRLPTREESKDSNWRKQTDSTTHADMHKDSKPRKRVRRSKSTKKAKPSPQVRPFGWFDLKIGANSSISYRMDMVAHAFGYRSSIDLDVTSTEMSTSVNHGMLWRTNRSYISCDLSNPLKWNALRNWTFDIKARQLELFLLRDHVFLLQDLIGDWGSGPGSTYYTFTPFRYVLKLQLNGFKLLLNANDHNVVNDPNDLEENTFLTIRGQQMTAEVMIPLDKYRPTYNEVTFDVSASDGGLDLTTPLWNTQAAFLHSNEVAPMKRLLIQGSYGYYTSNSPANTDTLTLHIHGCSLRVHLYGFLIRYLMKLKDNYLSEDVHFRTLDEYQKLRMEIEAKGAIDDESVTPTKVTNDLDVILNVEAESSSLMLPGNLYSANEHVRLDIALLSAELRFTNYYMDLEVNLSPVTAFLQDGTDVEETEARVASQPQGFVDGVRIYGHRLFGLPPTEPTYVCNWDFDVGAISGECSTIFLRTLAFGLRNFTLGFDDEENALPPLRPPVINDVTFLRARLDSVRAWLKVDGAAFLISTGAIKIDFSDLAGERFSDRIAVSLPDLSIACVHIKLNSGRTLLQPSSVDMIAYVQTSISLNMLETKYAFTKERQLQQGHVRYHDQRTHRTAFFLRSGSSAAVTNSHERSRAQINAPASIFPPMPEPLRNDSGQGRDDSSSLTSSKWGSSVSTPSRKSSFLSSSTQRSDVSVVRLKPRSSLQVSDGLSNRRSDSFVTTVSARHGPVTSTRQASLARHHSICDLHDDPLLHIPASSRQHHSGSFDRPRFPLDDVELDLDNVPLLPPAPAPENTSQGQRPLSQSQGFLSRAVDETATHTGIMIRTGLGVRAYFRPQALTKAILLLEGLQPTSPEQVFDKLQVDVTKGILAEDKTTIRQGKMTDISLSIPCLQLRIEDVYGRGSRDQSSEGTDRYNLTLSHLSVASRSKFSRRGDHQSGGDDGDGAKSSLVRVEIGTLTGSVEERSPQVRDVQVAMSASSDQMQFWLASEDITSVNLSCVRLDVQAKSDKIRYLANLSDRAANHGQRLQRSFNSLEEGRAKRLQDLVFAVVEEASGAPDPPLLTKPAYVLRSAARHLRLNDSWKIIARLRHMYYSVPPARREVFDLQSLRNSGHSPQEAQSRVADVMKQWRSWELAEIQRGLALKNIYGASADATLDEQARPVPVRASLTIMDARVVTDSGPRQSEVAVISLTAGLTVDDNSRGSGRHSTRANPPGMMTVLQIHAAKAVMRLNWELCELVENMIELRRERASWSTSTKSTTSVPDKSKQKPDSHYHIILAVDLASLMVDTVNLTSMSMSKGLVGSFTLTQRAEPARIASSSVVLHADVASSELISHSRILVVSKLRSPSIYVSLIHEEGDETFTKAWGLGATCHEITSDIQEGIPVLLELADLVIEDEFHHIRRLQSMAQKGTPNPKLPSSGAPKETNTVHMALFLDRFRISIVLLQALKYEILGTVARSSLNSYRSGHVVIDFDLKKHAHQVQTLMTRAAEDISVLEMPPINGRVVHCDRATERTFDVYLAIERVILDAAAIHSLVDTLSRPEMTRAMKEVLADFKVVKTHAREVMRTEDTAHVTSHDAASKAIIYSAHFTLGGFSVHATASGKQTDAEAAHMTFLLGCVQIQARNRLEQRGPPLEHPEIRVDMRRIGFELSRSVDGSNEPCGSLTLGAQISCSSRTTDTGSVTGAYCVHTDGIEIKLYAETASTVIGVLAHLQERIKDIDLSRERQYLKRLRNTNPPSEESGGDESSLTSEAEEPKELFSAMYSVVMRNTRISWVVGESVPSSSNGREREDLMLSSKQIDLSTSKANSARLSIENLQLQMIPASADKANRSPNSALLPEVVFNVAYLSTKDDRRLAFQAAGKSLDLRMTSQSILPANDLKTSIALASEKFRAAAASWQPVSSRRGSAGSTVSSSKKVLSRKRLSSLLVDADFAGAVVYVQGRKVPKTQEPLLGMLRGGRVPQHGRYGQFTQEDAASSTTLRAPGVALKLEYSDNGSDEPSLNAEVRVDAASNILYPTVVPLVMEISASVKEIVTTSEDSDEESKKEKVKGDQQETNGKRGPQKLLEDETILTGDPSTILGRTKLNVGLRICKQDFSLSCQPVARVAATANFEDIYVTFNTVKSTEHGHFFAVSAAFTRLQASVQHVYSRESTASFDVESIVLSLMNSKHVSDTGGLSTILKVSPMKAQINARQLQDFLLFREIWVPPEIRHASVPADRAQTNQPQPYLAQRYQQVATAGAFPWNAAVVIAELDVQLDLGQALGKSSFRIKQLWASSKKSSDWEQNLCLGFEEVGIDSTGRMSGFIELQHFKIRTSIQWPSRDLAFSETPLVQASVGFGRLRVKISFDYQAFLVANVTSFDFLMYNVHEERPKGDRLVGIMDGDKVQIFVTTTSAAQGTALYQAFERLVQEKRAQYFSSLRDIEKFLKRKSTVDNSNLPTQRVSPTKDQQKTEKEDEEKEDRAPVSLHTDVVVTLGEINFGVFPSTFFDNQIFKLEAAEVQTRFAVMTENEKIHSGLGLTLGRLRVALSSVRRPETPRNVAEASIDDVVSSATSSQGGTILRVPRVVARMQTWQISHSNHIDYIFKSSFEGKVDVGWNYARISSIRGMWAAHSRALAQRLGKPISQSAVKITGGPQPELPGDERSNIEGARDEGSTGEGGDGEQGKITAVVNVPQSRFQYTALEPPIIETPQLRDMGEATPPLEWIGLQRERLPNLTHQILIVTLLGLAGEVEDAYGRILGSS
ncbi:MAG: hypothetical protein M1817_003236 [Caeruleum heppii]|nr:MAG: hypothetical protein M1817_003236 [Caeruleum heppii]